MRNIARSILILGLLFGAAFVPALGARAQTDQPQIKITQVDNSKFPQVTVYLAVTNAAGEPVGIDPSTIQLSENGQVMQPTNSAGGSQGGGVGPLTAMLVMDVSGSMDKNGKIDGAKAAAKAFVDQMRPGDQAGLMVYNTKVNYVQQLTQDHAALIQAIDSIKTGGDTAMYDALIAAEQALKDASGRKAIIALTDGLDNRSTHKAPDVIAGTDQNSLSISTIGLGDAASRAQTGLDETALKELAQKAGGSYSFEGDAAALAALFKAYARSLQSEYAITYISPAKLRDGVNRSLTVSLAGGGAAAVQTSYNPGGLLPEVPTQSWVLFLGILGLLLVLLLVPILLRQFGSTGIGGFRGLGGSKKKGRIKLTDGSSSSTVNTPSQPATAARGRVKMK